MSAFNLITILGPTASGKTSLGVSLAKQIGGEILSADSRQVYTGLDIGSGKDLAEFGDVPYHLIDVVNPGDEYSVFRYQQDFFEAYAQVKNHNKVPIMVGGTGLYIDAITQNYQLTQVHENQDLRAELATDSLEQLQQRLIKLKPELHNDTDLLVRPRLVRAIEIAVFEQHNPKASKSKFPSIKSLLIGIQWDRSELRKRITLRLKQRFDEGLIEEVQDLHHQGVSYETLEFYGLEYRLVAQYLQGQLNQNDLQQKLNSKIHQFAKRQDTWFRKMQRRGDHIHWLDPSQNLCEQATIIIEQSKVEGL
ncbi:tRNA (adenosine(37)-N6)-dimethylallyltransferase MiaA [Alginatibacterium sediminis]|uniref:tRNA dimethylallyltransferase n=1 Tax=Alginatibacterium sediminis TaxID=2164068 RepID=A0A420EL32_9ALTE|nr:tRNA (adenosine(37)-N6)-dimethylallyltransferase MiaA [Alginatibacterium sediminis]RKF21314.1 tRNA (adenosine(37)-N6)-dimethylallyltransferase MiaA [Alginatibacterium sediminis]